MTKVLVGCSGWNYGDRFNKGGWVGPFYPDTKTRRLSYYSRHFDTAEFDAIFYEKFYSKMGRGTFLGMVKATPDNFQFSVKVPETITHVKRLDVEKSAGSDFEQYLQRISPLVQANKLGAILLQMPPSFSVNEFQQVEKFLKILPRQYDYALEFRHSSWQTEGPWEMLRHYNIAAVMTDSPDINLQYLSNSPITADHILIRLHGRKKGYWYNYLYNEQELKPWVDKVKVFQDDPHVKRLRIYFNNHYGGAAALNALEFKEMIGERLNAEQEKTRERLAAALRDNGRQLTLAS